MRIFIAIDIDKEIKSALGNLQQQLQSKVDVRKSDVKWVRPDNIHLTLKFLGEVEDKRIAEVCNIVKNVASQHLSFELEMKTVGCFGGKSPKVLWVGLGEGKGDLCRLQKEIEKQLLLAGWDEEKRGFSGHLTLCRIRNPRAAAKLAQVSEDYKDFKLGILPADSIKVYQSQLMPTGPIYTVLGDYKLQ